MPDTYILNMSAAFIKVFPCARLPFSFAIGCELAKHKHRA